MCKHLWNSRSGVQTFNHGHQKPARLYISAMQHLLTWRDEDQHSETAAKIRFSREEFFKQRKEKLASKLSTTVCRQLELLSEKGASCWLTSLPLKEYGFLLNKQEFQDALVLRYNLVLCTLDRHKQCICGQPNTADHCLICKLGAMSHYDMIPWRKQPLNKCARMLQMSQDC